MKKGYWADIGAQLVSVLASTVFQLVLLGVVGLLVWRKVFGSEKTVEKVVGDTIDAAATIPGGVVSVIGSTLRGESESGYITFAEQQARAAAALAAKRGQ